MPPQPIITVQLSSVLKNKLAHCADSIRGFGQRKLTEQEIGKAFNYISIIIKFYFSKMASTYSQ